MAYCVDILGCADGSFYTGTARDLSRRSMEHAEGALPSSYTFRRRPVSLVWSEEVDTENEALLHEHQIEGWSRTKKQALILGDYGAIHEIVRNERRSREIRKRKRIALSGESRVSAVERQESR